MPTADFGRRVESTMERVEESGAIHETNKELIQDFKRDLTLEGKSDARIQKLTSHLKVIAEEVDKPFSDMDKGDVKDLVEWVYGRDIAEATEVDYKKVIKQFFKWLDGEEGEYPDSVDWITTTAPNDNGTLPKDLLTRDDIDDLKAGCRNPRDRAFIALLYETGARIGEVIDLTVGDIEDHKHGKKVVVDGKTGQRRLPLVESTPAINTWLNQHPSGKSSDPLWCQLRSADEQLSYNYIRQKLLDRARERADIDKPINPHHFRHSRATHLATEFKEAQLCKWFGWVQGSSVPGKYVHLSGRDIDKTYEQLHGLEPEDEEEDQEPIKKCDRCEEINERGDKFCSRCGYSFDAAAAEQIEVIREEAEEAIPKTENETEAKLVQAVLKDLRKNPERVVEIMNEGDD